MKTKDKFLDYETLRYEDVSKSSGQTLFMERAWFYLCINKTQSAHVVLNISVFEN